MSHATFGVMSSINPLIIPYFLLYQFVFFSGWNTIPDIIEFMIGIVCGYVALNKNDNVT